MSRLVVKNLPNNVTKESLKETFSKKGVVTDVQLKYTKEGKFRHFGFVGFKSDEDASNALKYFDNSFINASRIRVELCADLGDSTKPKAWCERNKEVREIVKIREANKLLEATKEPEVEERSEAKIEPIPDVVDLFPASTQQINDGEKRPVNSVVAKMLKKHCNDPLFKEFMEVHASGDKTLWDNDIMNVITENQPLRKNKHITFDPEYEPPIEIQPIAEEVDVQKSDHLEVPEELHKVAEEKISDLEYLKRMTVKTTGETENKIDNTDIGSKKKTKKGGRKVEGENGDAGADLTKAAAAEAGSEQKPPRIKMPKQKKEFKDFFTVKLHGLSFKSGVSKKDTINDLRNFFRPLKLASLRLPQKISGFAYIGLKSEKEMRQALSKNHSFLGGKRISVTAYTKKEAKDAEDKNLPKWQAQEKSLKDEESIEESGRIFVRNLSYSTTEADLEVLFNAFGDTTEVSMPIDRYTRAPKGFAHVTYLFPANAKKAFDNLDGTVFNGRMLHLLPAKSKMSLEEVMEQDGLSFSAKKDLKQKMLSGSSHNWNSLFLGLNAVADVMASVYNTTKEQVLDARGSESLAVRLALGETQIVTQTKDFLVKNGVRLDAFNQAPKQRSKTVMLVKNLPAKTTENEIADLFSPHGQLQRVLLPPSGVTGIVEFVEPFEARSAFKRLAYTKFKSLPLYLEWAPLDTFVAPVAKQEPDTAVSTSKKENKKEHTKHHSQEPQAPAEDQNETPEPDTTLYVKNINFRTREEDLRKHFEKCGTIHSLTIAYHRNKKNMSESLSMGYGFVRFKKNASALLALKTLQKVPLQGHPLELTPSHRTVATEEASARKKAVIGEQNGSKIMVRNIPFQANHREIRELFKTFGELKTVRLPKKMTGGGAEQHRGFVFIEYESKSDAKRAFDALCQSTHLYGRRLVLEWAAKDDDVAQLRKRTADQFFSGPSKEKSMRSGTMIVDDAEMDKYEQTTN